MMLQLTQPIDHLSAHAFVHISGRQVFTIVFNPRRKEQPAYTATINFLLSNSMNTDFGSADDLHSVPS
eukprot:1158368-Pelagomonas_calceolata.AAC.11